MIKRTNMRKAIFALLTLIGMMGVERSWGQIPEQSLNLIRNPNFKTTSNLIPTPPQNYIIEPERTLWKMNGIDELPNANSGTDPNCNFYSSVNPHQFRTNNTTLWSPMNPTCNGGVKTNWIHAGSPDFFYNTTSLGYLTSIQSRPK